MAIRPPGWPGGRLRPTTELEALLAAAQADLVSDPHDPDYQRGIIATLMWALGRTAEPPLTDRTVASPTVDDIYQEEEIATKMMYGEFGRIERVTQAFLVGVEATSLWCRSKTDEPPIDVDLSITR